MEIHNVIKKYACQHCSYTANTLSYLKVHHTRSHKGLPYKNVDVPVVEETGMGSSGASQVKLYTVKYRHTLILNSSSQQSQFHPSNLKIVLKHFEYNK